MVSNPLACVFFIGSQLGNKNLKLPPHTKSYLLKSELSFTPLFRYEPFGADSMTKKWFVLDMIGFGTPLPLIIIWRMFVTFMIRWRLMRTPKLLT